jgi:hypothetical protein
MITLRNITIPLLSYISAKFFKKGIPIITLFGLATLKPNGLQFSYPILAQFLAFQNRTLLGNPMAQFGAGFIPK